MGYLNCNQFNSYLLIVMFLLLVVLGKMTDQMIRFQYYFVVHEQSISETMFLLTCIFWPTTSFLYTITKHK